MATRKELLAQQIAKAVGAGKAASLETVDFNDPNRPKTCLEVDFPVLPINQVAVIEGNAGKPIYQMSKWWARRRSSVFRSMLIAAAAKAPDDPSRAAKLIWDNYYANHQKKGAFKHLKVVDIFMGGGTTLVEGSRLGMQMFGNDLNPVAWFIVRQELASIDKEEVKRLIADVEAEVKPQIMPFYYCDGPAGERGQWVHLPTGRIEGPEFNPLILTPEQRTQYRYEGPEILHTFWAKHGPCHVTGCGHRTPVMTSPLVAVKTLTVKTWQHTCRACGAGFDVEEKHARIAPEVPLYISSTEKSYTVIDPKRGVVCPICSYSELVTSRTSVNKKVHLSLLVHPQWLGGAQRVDAEGREFGGSPGDDATSTTKWIDERSSSIRLLEVRGELPETVRCPETNVTFKTGKGGGTAVPGSFTCAACGTSQEIVTALRQTGKPAPVAAYAVQGYSPRGDSAISSYGGRFFMPFDGKLARQLNAATQEWEQLRDTVLDGFWPKSEIPESLRATVKDVITSGHGYRYWTDMFNPRQMLVHAHLLKAIVEVGNYAWDVREYVLGAFQQYLRAQSMFSFWHITKDHYAPALSNGDYRPKMTVVEVGVFSPVGYGNWASALKPILEGAEWADSPWELVPTATLEKSDPNIATAVVGKSEKVYPGDRVQGGHLSQGSSTELAQFADSTIDIVCTDPPFGNLVQYSELADFFYVWMRLVLRKRHPELFSGEYTPKTLEAVANSFREPENPDGFYQRLLTQCWREANRILKPGGILAFTFHHSEDDPWVAVLESLFEAGFYLEATYPIRSDETKGDNAEFGSQKIEYDIIHICRKRVAEPKAVSWGRMRREVLADVRLLQELLENHAKQGLPAADLQVIRRGKALEYFSRHYGKVYVDEGRTISVKEALVGINQLIDEDSNSLHEPPPVTAEPITRQFLRIFDGKAEVARDQMQKFLRGSGMTPDEFEQRGWCRERNKIFETTIPLDFAREWYGRHRRKLTSDLDQALVLIGACYDGSGINASDTLKNEHFRPHPALKSLLEWLTNHGADQQMRNASMRALAIYKAWAASNRPQAQQLTLFDEDTP
jgi:putative DNA methylase